MTATRFNDQVVVVTGASAGIGREVAARFVAEGARVVLVARGAEALEATAAELGERAIPMQGDIADLERMQAILDHAVERFGGVDGVVNNAALHHRGPVASRSVDEIATMVDVNVKAPLTFIRMALPMLQVRGGFVVNVASLAGCGPVGGAATYSATKAAMRVFTMALAEELVGTGVSVSIVSPGPVETDFIMDHLEEVADITFSQPVCSPGFVADMVLDCAADGRLERAWPTGTRYLAGVGFLFPAVRRWLVPALARKGARAKQALLSRRRGAA